MITHDARWSLSRGKNPVPSAWQATPPSLERTGPARACATTGRFLAGGALESRPARPDMSTAPARGLIIVVVQKTAAPMDTDAPTLRRWALPRGYPAERS